MAKPSQSVIQRLAHRVRAAFGGARQDEAMADLGRRLARIERQLDSVEKIWQRTRHVEPAVQALLRERYLDASSLPYPERLTARRFRISSQNQEDGLTIALLNEVGATCRRFVEIGSGLSGGNSGFLARECGWSGLMVDGHAGAHGPGRPTFSDGDGGGRVGDARQHQRADLRQRLRRRSGSVQPRSGWMRLLDLGSDDGLLAARRHPRIQLDVRCRSIGHDPVRCEVRPPSAITRRTTARR